ncbi:MAG: DUF2029 domain-containing protein [Acidobacteriota bacterium]|nr:DUF2029 domain-containing protein [Acidobacteriota bacterium]
MTRRPFYLGWLLYSVLLLGLCFTLARLHTAESFDFRSFYAAGHILRTHPAQLYDPATELTTQNQYVSPLQEPLPFYHLSYEALLYLPFSLLPFRVAYLAYAGFNLLLLPLLMRCSASAFDGTIPIWQPRPGWMLFPYFPLMIALWQGQNSLLFLVLLGLTWHILQRGRLTLAGALLGLGLFKPQLALPIALLLALRYRRDFIVGFIASSAAVLALCGTVLRAAGMRAQWHLLLLGSLLSDQSSRAQQAMAVKPAAMPNLLGLLYVCGTRHLPPTTAVVVVLLTSLVALVATGRALRNIEDCSVVFSVAVLVAVLLSYHLYIHDLTVLLLPMALLGKRTSPYSLGALYLLPVLLLLYGGRNQIWLLAVPTLSLVVEALRSGNATLSANTALPTDHSHP